MCNKSVWWVIFLPLIISAVSTDPSKEHAKDIITSAINGYAAILDRMSTIYQILTNSKTYDTRQQDFFHRNRRKIERSILRNDDEHEIIDELLTQYDERVPKKRNKRYPYASKKTDSYSIPIIDDILGLNEDTEPEPEQFHKNMNKKQNNAQYEYIRRRLREEPYEDIVCNNNKTSPYNTEYKFNFKPFDNCNTSSNDNDTVFHTTSVITTIYTVDEAILYSANCEFMLILDETVGALQTMASQQTNPLWTSNDNALLPTSDDINGSLMMKFNSDNGELDVYDGNTVKWSNVNDAHWIEKDNDAEYTFVAPYSLALSNDLGSLYVMDHNHKIKWYASPAVNNDKLNARDTLYHVNLTDGKTGEVLYSMSMAVFLIVHREKIFALEFQYISEGNVSDAQQKYVDIMHNLVYKFNVSVYELSSHNLGDTYVVYDTSLPMIYSLINGKQQILSISESHTFLCIDNETRYFNVEVIPFTYEIPVQYEDNNYTLNIYATESNSNTNYTFYVNPWNPCNDGTPVLAQKLMRECFVSYDVDEAISEFNTYSANSAYSNVNMKYIGFESESSAKCVTKILAGNNTNVTVTFPSNFSADSCTNYMIQNMTKINEYFNSKYCELLRSDCVAVNDGYYDICLDFTHKLCTCYCPRDKKGTHCDEYRDYDCKLNILNANMTECEAMTQEELNAHGRSDYDVTLDGDKPCFFITDTIESVVQLSCYFVDGESAHSQVWESLSDYTYDDNISISFDYCLGNETSPFSFTSAPPESYLRLKIFNFARIFSDNETYTIPLDINHWSGNKYVFHNKSMDDLQDNYKIGGRVYIEYQLWQTEESGYTQNRINVERRFYDIDHWQMPMSLDQKYDSSQKWFIVICTIAALVLTVYCVSQCNKWCKKLEHEKND